VLILAHTLDLALALLTLALAHTLDLALALLTLALVHTLDVGSRPTLAIATPHQPTIIPPLPSRYVSVTLPPTGCP